VRPEAPSGVPPSSDEPPHAGLLAGSHRAQRRHSHAPDVPVEVDHEVLHHFRHRGGAGRASLRAQRHGKASISRGAAHPGGQSPGVHATLCSPRRKSPSPLLAADGRRQPSEGERWSQVACPAARTQQLLCVCVDLRDPPSAHSSAQAAARRYNSGTASELSRLKALACSLKSYTSHLSVHYSPCFRQPIACTVVAQDEPKTNIAALRRAKTDVARRNISPRYLLDIASI
jgi:hypothetical protein